MGQETSASTDFTGTLGEFGQGVEKAVGAGHGLDKVPGLYENRPEVEDNVSSFINLAFIITIL